MKRINDLAKRIDKFFNLPVIYRRREIKKYEIDYSNLPEFDYSEEKYNDEK